MNQQFSINEFISASDKFIDHLAHQLLENQAEMSIEMASDIPDEYKTFEDVEALLDNANELVVDYFKDFMAEIELAILDKLKKLKVQPVALKLNKDGLVDAQYEVVDVK